jgi:hypothetical protein
VIVLRLPSFLSILHIQLFTVLGLGHEKKRLEKNVKVGGVVYELTKTFPVSFLQQECIKT